MRVHRFSAAILVSVTLGACAAGSNPDVDLAAEEAAVRAASHAIVLAEQAKDIQGAMAHWTEDAVLQFEGAPAIQGTDGLRSAYEMFLGDTTMLSFEGTTTDVEVASGGGLAWEHGVNRFQFQGAEGPMDVVGKYLAVWRKTNEGWKIAALAVTNDTPMGEM